MAGNNVLPRMFSSSKNSYAGIKELSGSIEMQKKRNSPYNKNPESTTKKRRMIP